MNTNCASANVFAAQCEPCFGRRNQKAWRGLKPKIVSGDGDF
jgi:hypothetical protein